MDGQLQVSINHMHKFYQSQDVELMRMHSAANNQNNCESKPIFSLVPEVMVFCVHCGVVSYMLIIKVMIMALYSDWVGLVHDDVLS